MVLKKYFLDGSFLDLNLKASPLANILILPVTIHRLPSNQIYIIIFGRCLSLTFGIIRVNLQFTFMKKEVILAIIIGIFVGLGITFLLYNARQALIPTNNSVTQSPEPTDEPTATPNNNLLVITQPEDQSVLTQAENKLTGSTLPNQIVVVFVNDSQEILQANDTGAFSTDIELENGSNVIRVVSVSSTGEKIEQEIEVILSNIPLETDQTNQEQSNE